MAKGGLPLRTSLGKLKAKFDDPQVQTLAREVEDGSTISEAFEKANFSEFEVNLVNAGERSGQLELIYEQLAQFWRQEDKLLGSLWRQAIYPLVILHLAALFYPLPGALEALHTGFMFGVFTYMFSLMFLLFMIYLVGFSLYIIISHLWRTPAGQMMLLHLPLVGRTWRATYAFRWIFALRLEHGAGLPLSEAVYDAWQATGYAERDAPAEQGKEHILAGEPLSTIYPKWKGQLPPDWEDYIEAGEISGKLSDTFLSLQDQALSEWTNASAQVNEWLPRFFLVGILILAIGLFFSAFFKYFWQVFTIFDTIPKM